MPAVVKSIKGMLRIIHFAGDENIIAELGALCPACGFEHVFRVDLDNHGYWKGDHWEFNGDYDKPTFSPSMLCSQEPRHPVCHSYLEDGKWRFLDDCSHDMAGQTVDMIPPDPNMSWKRQHGWQHFEGHEDC